MGNVKGFKQYIITNIAKLDNGEFNAKLLKAKLDSLSDNEIDKLYQDLKSESMYLPFYIANSKTQKIDIKKWIELAKDLGVDTFTKIVEEDPKTGQVYTTDIEYWVAMFPVRRHLHYLDAKRSLAKDNKTRDTLTGQVTGASKGSSFSKPQLMGVLSRGCVANALELYKYRGGDISGGREFNKQLIENGGVSLNSLIKTKTTPVATKTLGAYLSGMHLQHNLTRD